MKKKLIYSSALAAFLSASIAQAGGPEIIPVEDYFSGFYVGGTGSVHHVDFNGSSSVDLIQNIAIPTVPPTNILLAGNLINGDINNHSIDGFGGVQGGWGWTFNHLWYVGVQGFGEWGGQGQTTTATLVPINVNLLGIITDKATVTNTATVKLANDYGVAAKFGFVVAPRTLVYGKVGASWAQLSVSQRLTAVNDFNILPPIVLNLHSVASSYSGSESTKLGLLLGIGAEQFVYQDLVSVNIEYNYVNYGSVNTGPAPTLAATSATVLGFGPIAVGNPVVLPVTTSAHTNATVNSLLGGINFYFGRNWWF